MNDAFAPLLFTAWLIACLAFLSWLCAGAVEDDEPRAVLPPENLDDLIHEIACTTDLDKLQQLAVRATHLPAAAAHQCLDLIQSQLNQR